MAKQRKDEAALTAQDRRDDADMKSVYAIVCNVAGAPGRNSLCSE